jgi:hypothetical protein
MTASRRARTASGTPSTRVSYATVSAALGDSPPRRAIRDIPDSSWARLAGRTIVFGHRSIGANLIESLEAWAAREPRVRLRIARLSPDGRGGPGESGKALLEASIGQDGAPERKTTDFLSLLASPAGQRADVALHKYCYRDFGPDSDPAAIFAHYQTRMEQLRRERPRLLLAHVTAPLTSRERPVKAAIRRLLGRPTTDELNLKRAEFNVLLRSAYAGRDPIFDLAGYESSGPDGRRTAALVGGKLTPHLAPAWTDDGATLNPAGRMAIGEQFLAFLAGLP